MFTCCPQCDTVFRVTANQLRAARGDVRCGNCAHVFNAMEFLADELPRLSDEPEPDASESADDSLEFDAPEQTWGEIFIAAPPQPGDIPLDGELEAITANPDEWRSMLAELGVEPGDVGPVIEEEIGIEMAAASLQAEDDADAFLPAPDEGDATSEPAWVVDDGEQGAAVDGDAAIDRAFVATTAMESAVSAAAAAQPDDEGDYPGAAALPVDDELDPDLPPWNELEPIEVVEVQRGGHTGWAVAACVLAVLLLVQLTHQSRDSLAAHPRYGELVRNTYERIGQRLYPDWSLDAFYVRRSEALAGGSAPDALDINAAVEVTGAQSVGLPLVRVTLRDQWSNTVGRRVFLPAEYLAADVPGIVPPGTRIPVALSLADPGSAARGYEVDLCLQRRWKGLECQLAERPYQP